MRLTGTGLFIFGQFIQSVPFHLYSEKLRPSSCSELRAGDRTPPGAGWQTAPEPHQSQENAARTGLGTEQPPSLKDRGCRDVWALGHPPQGHQPGCPGPPSPTHGQGAAWPPVPPCKHSWGRSAEVVLLGALWKHPKGSVSSEAEERLVDQSSPDRSPERSHQAGLADALPRPSNMLGGAAHQLWHRLRWTRVVGLAKRQEGNKHPSVCSF